MSDIVTYGVIGILVLGLLLLLFCVVVVIIKVISHDIAIEKETKMK